MAMSKLAAWFVATEIRTLRNEAGLSQERAGALMMRHRNTIAAWEAGTSLPALDSIRGICHHLGATAERTEYLEAVIRQHRTTGLVDDLVDIHDIYCLAHAERFYGEVSKWEPQFIPGVLQTEEYHFSPLTRDYRVDENILSRTWQVKSSRQKEYRDREPVPTTRVILGGDSIRFLDHIENRRKQVDYLLESAELPGWEIRVIQQPHPGMRGGFDVLKPAGFKHAGPAFSYVETLDTSLYIEEQHRVQAYDQAYKGMWDRAIPIKEYIDGT
ncbi:Scr1 family TA system antitoxin-like transcriptional regulator [Natronoglycomyces albus]|uniref:Helix-turn-helix transcriptional regulator n=1 Tax=Natronoglycomyces albus TaxID=2811108 RepID=A0A895XNS9_9ACTN|nr:Scr1 family TA system antitoxin-like transcriptional regulator [Natronoglycomyces albus]QSB03950.1 helix-turn-helix transcriptional regulator [Natronoglycomyces albus]